MERNPTVKTEIAQKREIFGESVTYGFLGYPVSQAADITAFDATIVPVGEDQLPLIEQCREIVRKFNSIYGEVLREPEAYLSDAKRIKGLDGNEKMGKSLGNAIYLSDSEEKITRKVMSAVTDPNRIRKDDKGDPSNCEVIYDYWKIFGTNEEVEEICSGCKNATMGCMECKKRLAQKVNDYFKPIREKRKELGNNMDYIYKIAYEGTEKAKKITSQTLEKVKNHMQIGYKEIKEAAL